MANVIFQPNTAGLEQFIQALLTSGKEAIDEAYKVLRVAMQEYKRRVQRATPVEHGTMRQSWQVVTNRDEKSISGELGTSLRSEEGYPYPLILELGSERIAGGKVMAWKPGDQPILDWPAKRANAGLKTGLSRDTSGGATGRERNYAGQFVKGGRAEQMPLVRPIGYEIAPRVVQVMSKALSVGFKQALDGKRF